MHLAPFLLPFLLRLVVLAPLFAIGFFNITTIRIILIRYDLAFTVTLVRELFYFFEPSFFPVLAISRANFLGPAAQALLCPGLRPVTSITVTTIVFHDFRFVNLVNSSFVVPATAVLQIFAFFAEDYLSIRYVINSLINIVPFEACFLFLDEQLQRLVLDILLILEAHEVALIIRQQLYVFE